MTETPETPEPGDIGDQLAQFADEAAEWAELDLAAGTEGWPDEDWTDERP